MSETQDAKDFMLKLNTNYYGIAEQENFPSSFFVARGASVTTRLTCKPNANCTQDPPKGAPILIQAGIKCSIDLFYFNIPMLAHMIFAP